ncbi:VOC family protein [Photobacterium chitinilyticum]|uniref:VOC family protein n=1 Tax=Photobacterium chitinilyticum TaxID=2485123 RepID=A0A3S3UKR0_9GAMM|nr:VOC family protein [Photobacterium chitinilyticum]RWX54750.1 VOC family protein [Photobacterium chitinilyticum]
MDNSQKEKHEKINYVEFPAINLAATKAFFIQAFGWDFVDYGDGYSAFSNQGLDGGFFQSTLSSTTANGSALVVLYSQDLELSLLNVEKAGGIIVRPIFSFPGGRRFHFTEPSGNELAIWSDN